MRRTGLVWWMRVAIRWASNCGRVRGGTPENGYAEGVAVSIGSRGLSAEVAGCGGGRPKVRPGPHDMLRQHGWKTILRPWSCTSRRRAMPGPVGPRHLRRLGVSPPRASPATAPPPRSPKGEWTLAPGEGGAAGLPLSAEFGLRLEPIPPIVPMPAPAGEEERVGAGGQFVAGQRDCQGCPFRGRTRGIAVAPCAGGRPIGRLGRSGRSWLGHASRSSVFQIADVRCVSPTAGRRRIPGRFSQLRISGAGATGVRASSTGPGLSPRVAKSVWQSMHPRCPAGWTMRRTSYPHRGHWATRRRVPCGSVTCSGSMGRRGCPQQRIGGVHSTREGTPSGSEVTSISARHTPQRNPRTLPMTRPPFHSLRPIPQRSPEKKNAPLPLLQRESRASLPPGATPHGVPGIPLRAKKCVPYVLRHLPVVNRQFRSASENRGARPWLTQARCSSRCKAGLGWIPGVH
jgi:hypothetical protein